MHPAKQVNWTLDNVIGALREELRKPTAHAGFMWREAAMAKARPLVIFLRCIGRGNEDIIHTLAGRGVPISESMVEDILRQAAGIVPKRKNTGRRTIEDCDRQQVLIALCEILPRENVDPELLREYEEVKALTKPGRAEC